MSVNIQFTYDTKSKKALKARWLILGVAYTGRNYSPLLMCRNWGNSLNMKAAFFTLHIVFVIEIYFSSFHTSKAGLKLHHVINPLEVVNMQLWLLHNAQNSVYKYTYLTYETFFNYKNLIHCRQNSGVVSDKNPCL